MNLDSQGVVGSIAEHIETTKNCYEPQYYSYITAHATHSTCILHEYFEYLHIGENGISRCGQCLSVIGPSGVPVECMISGFYKVKANSSLDVNSTKYMIGVGNDQFFQITSKINSTADQYSQVTIQDVDCPFITFPAILITEKTSTNYKAQIINSNHLPTRIVKNRNSVPITSGATVLGISVGSVESVRFCDREDYCLKFEFELDNNPFQIVYSEVLFPQNQFKQCEFLPNTNCWSDKAVDRKNNVYLDWVFFQMNPDLTNPRVNVSSGQLKFVAIGERVTMIYHITTSIQMNMMFAYFELEAEIKGKMLFNFTHIGMNSVKKTETLEEGKLICPLQNTVRTIKEENGKQILYLRVYFDIKCKGFTNFISITHTTDIGSEILIKKAKLVQRESISNKLCSTNSFDCLSTECSSKTNKTYIWESGCEPKCGICRSGQYCSEEGKCVQQENFNARNSTPPIVYLLMMIAILLIV